MIPGEEQFIKRKGEILYYYGPTKGDVRKCSSYPSGSKALRGVGGDVIYLEEAAFMDLKMFNEVIVPLLELETTALICISTPQDSTNFYSLMFEMKDPSRCTICLISRRLRWCAKIVKKAQTPKIVPI